MSQNRKEPVTAHSPGSAACFEDEGVGGIEPDRAGQLERPCQTFGMPVAGSNQAGSRSASAQRKALDAGRAMDQEIAVAGDAAALAGLADGEAREIALGDRVEALLREGVEAEHEIAGEALDDGRPVRLKALLLQRRRRRPRAGIAEPDPGRRDHGREDEPIRHLVLASTPPASRGVRRRSGRR